MGLLDFLRRLFGAAPQPPPRAAAGRSTHAIAPQARLSVPAPPPPPRAQPPQRRETSLNLDAAQFQPLSGEQVRTAAAGVQFTGFFEFGRRDRIPSDLDPRTKLIDQAMVGQGLITPEELVRIHEIGRQMDELRPELAGAHIAAERAVQADREERKRIREQKKADAERRKREHAQRVAHNRQTDIVYLGRGVSKGLADRRSNVEKLQAAGLPVLSTPADLAAALGIEVSRLRWLAFHAEASAVSHYVYFMVPKKSGGERLLSAPHASMAAAQRWILDHILAKLAAHDAAHGFVPGRSILTNARPHVGSAVVLNCDLCDFFPSITANRVIGFFRQIGYSPAVATIMGLLTTECPRRKVLFRGEPWYVATGSRGLPQGACTSPALSNLISRRLDARLHGIARRLGWTYTRYADDITLSAKEPSERIGYMLARVCHIAENEGFAVNEKKTRVLRQSARQGITGVVTNVTLSVPRPLRRRLRAILHNASRTGLTAQNRKRHPHFRAWLDGTIAYIRMINPEQAERLAQQLRDLDRE
jgi:RNA-directed DNA polymerase